MPWPVGDIERFNRNSVVTNGNLGAGYNTAGIGFADDLFVIMDRPRIAWMQRSVIREGGVNLSRMPFHFIRATGLDYKNRVRTNTPDKSSLMEAYSDDELDGLAQLLAGQ